MIHWRSRGFKAKLLVLLVTSFLLYAIWSATEDNYGVESELIIQRHKADQSHNDEHTGVRICTQRERQNHVTATCANLTSKYMDYSNSICFKAVNPEMEGQGPCMLVDHQHRVAFCGITKSGSSTGTAMMMNYGPHRNKAPSKYQKGQVHAPEMKSQMGLVQEIYSSKLDNYTKFMIVRHPLDRLVSSFLDKMQTVHTTGRFKSIRLAISVIYGNLKWGDLNGPLEDMPDVNVSFEHFMKMLTDPRPKPQVADEHWAPSALLCDPCRVRYDYIMRTESLHHDAKLFIQHVYHQENGSIPSENVIRNTANSAQRRIFNKVLSKYYDSVTKGDLYLLMNKYKTDLELYGYYFNTDTYEAQCHIQSQNGTCC